MAGRIWSMIFGESGEDAFYEVHGTVTSMRENMRWDTELTITVFASNRHDAQIKALHQYSTGQVTPLDFCEWKRVKYVRRKP